MSYYVTQIFHRTLRLNAAPTWNASPEHPTRQHGTVETQQHKPKILKTHSGKETIWQRITFAWLEVKTNDS